MKTISLLFVSDTHLGFDLPFRPRIKRRRRGPDFFKNFELALAPAWKGETDAVIHGGDLFFRSKVPPQLVQMAFEPLIKVADSGTPVYLVPGNHERSVIPYRILAAHPNIHIFDRPKTFLLKTKNIKLVLVGFPYVRHHIRYNFLQVLEQTGWRSTQADASLLCIHHCFEGATLISGSRFYTFRNSHDVIKLSDIPHEFTAVLSGHIHRFQVLTKDLKGNPLATPVFYPGSIERTSFTEKDEAKGYLTLKISIDELGSKGKPGSVMLSQWQFHELPTRTMKQLELHANGFNASALESWIKNALKTLPGDSVVKVRIYGKLPGDSLDVLSAKSLRLLSPPTMNLTTTLVDYRHFSKKIPGEKR